MKEIYRVTIHGRRLESADVRKLLARAVAEKRNMDRILRSNSEVGRFRTRIGQSPLNAAGEPFRAAT